jgi:DNA-binding transcriptional ArsR family regulator
MAGRPKTSRQEEATAAGCAVTEHARRQPRPRPTDEAFERAAGIFRAAGEVTRLRLLARLSEGEWCVTELAEAAGAPLPVVSQQLSVLRAQHIVRHRRAGKHIYYSLLDEHVIEMIHNALEHASEERKGQGTE